jgi:hypothetical protein
VEKPVHWLMEATPLNGASVPIVFLSNLAITDELHDLTIQLHKYFIVEA